MTCALYEGSRAPLPLHDLAAISNALRRPEAFVRLDVVDPAATDFATIRDEFGLHPLAIEDAVKAHQRPKIEAYGEYWFVVIHGVSRMQDTVTIHEIALFAGKRFIVTVRAEPVFALDEVLRRWNNQPAKLKHDSGALLYEILERLDDGYSPVVEAFEERVSEFETTLLADGKPSDTLLREIFSLKKDVLRFRRAVLPLRELLAPIIRGDITLFEAEELPYYRDVLDHVVRVIEQMDAARDLVTNALDIHLGLVANRQAENAKRQSEVAKQLTIIATIFLPLTYITGFFGQNFGFMVAHVTSERTFWLLGVGSQVIALLALLAYFRYKRWF